MIPAPRALIAPACAVRPVFGLDVLAVGTLVVVVVDLGVLRLGRVERGYLAQSGHLLPSSLAPGGHRLRGDGHGLACPTKRLRQPRQHREVSVKRDLLQATDAGGARP